MIGLIIALLAGIAVGNDAKKRGMNAWGWGIGVFLLLIIFLPIYFITRKPLLENQKMEHDDDIIDNLDSL